MDEEKYKELLIELLEKNGRVFVITPEGDDDVLLWKR